jgi:hypothetical protein
VRDNVRRLCRIGIISLLALDEINHATSNNDLY